MQVWYQKAGIAALATAAAVLAVPAFGDTAPAPIVQFPAFTGDVVDDAHALSPEAQTVLRQDLAHLNHITGHRLVVATVATLGGRDIEAYGADLLRAWQVAGKAGNDGAVLIIAPNDHAQRIITGAGLTPNLTSAVSDVILRDTVAPYLKAGNVDEAALEGARAIGQVITPVEAKAVAAPVTTPVVTPVAPPVTKAKAEETPAFGLPVNMPINMPVDLWLILANAGNFAVLAYAAMKLIQALTAWRRMDKAEPAPKGPAPVLKLRPQPEEVMASVQRLIDDEEGRPPLNLAANTGWDEFFAVPEAGPDDGPERLPDEDEDKEQATEEKVAVRARA